MGYPLEIEVQVLRNMLPFGRPSVAWIGVPDLTATPGRRFPIKVFPATDDAAGRELLVTLSDIAESREGWVTFTCELHIDGYPIGMARPGTVFKEATDIPSGVIHFPTLMGGESGAFTGAFTVMVRAYRAYEPIIKENGNG